MPDQYEEAAKEAAKLNSTISATTGAMRALAMAGQSASADMKILMEELAKAKAASDFGAEIAKLNEEIKKGAKGAEKALAQYIKITEVMANTEGVDAQIEGLEKLYSEQKKNAAAQVALAKTEGKFLKAAMLENWNAIKDGVKSSSGKTSLAKGAAGAIDLAKDPGKMLDMMGPWGVILKMIIDVIDQARKLRGEFMAANSASGNFSNGLKSIAKATRESANVMGSQTSFTTMGFSIEEVTDAYKALKSTGIESLGAVGEGLNENAINVISFAKASGESMEVVAGRLADLRRNFGKATDGQASQAYFKVLKTGEAVAQSGAMKLGDYMQAVYSLSDAFKDVGGGVEDVNMILSSTTKIMQGMGVPLGNIQKVAQGIIGISKASEGWKVFMAKQSGVQGGYAESLYSAEQRGQDFSVTKAGKFDAKKMIEMAQNAILKPTAGMQGANRQYMVEKMGKQFGMDEETTQVFQKLAAGAISQDEAAGSLQDLHEAAAKNAMDAKGMFDIIRNILMGMIAKPIIAIWAWLSSDPAAKKMGKAVDKAAGPNIFGGDNGTVNVGSAANKAGMALAKSSDQQASAEKAAAGSASGSTGGTSSKKETIHRIILEANGKEILDTAKAHTRKTVSKATVGLASGVK
jgi:uncharacterized protein YfiM (DUF2279 family)